MGDSRAHEQRKVKGAEDYFPEILFVLKIQDTFVYFLS